jgi:hypothetical protein
VRNAGATLLLLSIMGFFYASSRLGEAEPLPGGLSVSEVLQRPAGRWDLARYGCLAVAGLGLLVALFPKGR